MNELDKLELYLKQNKYCFARHDRYPGKRVIDIYTGINGSEGYQGEGEKHQIVVYYDDGRMWFDAICHWGSYGFEEGLLEVMGPVGIVKADGFDTVEGHLTADEVIRRIEEYGERR